MVINFLCINSMIIQLIGTALNVLGNEKKHVSFPEIKELFCIKISFDWIHERSSKTVGSGRFI